MKIGSTFTCPIGGNASLKSVTLDGITNTRQLWDTNFALNNFFFLLLSIENKKKMGNGITMLANAFLSKWNNFFSFENGFMD